MTLIFQSMSIGEVRTYGAAPFGAAVIHGGPGAPGYMASVARELSPSTGVLEPLQSAASLDGQVDELAEQLRPYNSGAITLIGSSWGATLSLLVAAKSRLVLRKLILIGSAVFDAENSARTRETRLGRLSASDRDAFMLLNAELSGAAREQRNERLVRMVKLLDPVDFFDPISTDLETIAVHADINHQVWADFVQLRDDGDRLRRLFANIAIPVVIIHGDYDPHPLAGVEPFLRSCVSDVTTHLLSRCGHYPWMERHARAEFFRLVKKEIGIDVNA